MEPKSHEINNENVVIYKKWNYTLQQIILTL